MTDPPNASRNPTSFYRASRMGGFDDLDFGVAQAVQLVDELVNLPVGGVDLPLEDGLIP